MNRQDNIQDELKEIRDILNRLDKEIHKNILGLSKKIFESQLSMTREVQEILNLCLKLDNWELDSQNLSREAMKRNIVGMNLDQRFWNKVLVGLCVFIFATMVICLYMVLYDTYLSEELLARVTRRVKEGNIAEISPPLQMEDTPEWYKRKSFLLGMGCLCIFTVYCVSKISTYGFWDSILPASKKQFDKDSLDLQNKLNDVNQEILRTRQGAQSRIDDINQLVDINHKEIQAIQEEIQDTPIKSLDEAVDHLKGSEKALSSKVDALGEGASLQVEQLSVLAGRISEAMRNPPAMGQSPTEEIHPFVIERHQVRRGDGKFLGLKASPRKDLEALEPPSKGEVASSDPSSSGEGSHS
jgi:hypothetical protein